MQTITIAELKQALARLPAYEPTAVLALYRRERAAQQRDLPLLSHLCPTTVAAAAEEADGYRQRIFKLKGNLQQLRAIPLPIPCEEFGL